MLTNESHSCELGSFQWLCYCSTQSPSITCARNEENDDGVGFCTLEKGHSYITFISDAEGLLTHALGVCIVHFGSEPTGNIDWWNQFTMLILLLSLKDHCDPLGNDKLSSSYNLLYFKLSMVSKTIIIAVLNVRMRHLCHLLEA